MILWHLGLATVIVYVTLGRRRIDYRYILIGAVVPDIVDGILGLFVFDGPAGRWIAHSLLANVAVTIAIILVLRGETRVAVFGIGVGWLTHLVGDAMWDAPQTFFWPLAGTELSEGGRGATEPYSWALFTAPLENIWVWLREVAGVAILAWFWIAFRLGDPQRRKLFLKDGYLRP